MGFKTKNLSQGEHAVIICDNNQPRFKNPKVIHSHDKTNNVSLVTNVIYY